MEVLVVMGLLGILLSLLLPGLGRTRNLARDRISVVNIRDLGLATFVYAGDNRDMPPTLFAPVYANIKEGLQEVRALDGTLLRGGWFNNGSFPHAVFASEPPPRASIRDPRAPGLRDGSMTGPMRYFSDYRLSNSLYASVKYWDLDTQRGPPQWRVQSLSSVVFPSAKGLGRQLTVYSVPGFPDGYAACCAQEVRSAVLWADTSAEITVQADLRPGVPNAWHHGSVGPTNIFKKGVPIDNTQDGVAGRDH